MPNKGKSKKVRKLRGHVSQGKGRIGKHRKHDKGRGNAGGQHHNRTWFDRYHPGYFGKYGQRIYHKNHNLLYCKELPVGQIWDLVTDKTYEETLKMCNDLKEKSGKDKEKTKVVPLIDVTKFGYFKINEKGSLPKRPVAIRARFFTEAAVDKIKEVGGVCLLTA